MQFTELFTRIFRACGLRQGEIPGVDVSYVRAMLNDAWVPDDDDFIRRLAVQLSVCALGIAQDRRPDVPGPEEWLKAARSQFADRRPARIRYKKSGVRLAQLAERLELATKPTHPELHVIAPLPRSAPQFRGRGDILQTLDSDWARPEVHISCLVGFGGIGKSTVVNNWLDKFCTKSGMRAERIIIYSFYKQGFTEGAVSSDVFIHEALRRCGDPKPASGSQPEKGTRLAKLLQNKRTLLVLDGLETLQERLDLDDARIRDPGMFRLLTNLAWVNCGLVVVTSRLKLSDLRPQETGPVVPRDVEGLSPADGADLLRDLGVIGTRKQLERASSVVTGHCLALQLLGNYLREVHDGDVDGYRALRLLERTSTAVDKAKRIMSEYEQHLEPSEAALMRIVSLFDRPSDGPSLQSLMQNSGLEGITVGLPPFAQREWRRVVKRLQEAGLLNRNDEGSLTELDCHPLVREHFARQAAQSFPESWRQANAVLSEHFSGERRESPETEAEADLLCRAISHGCRAGLQLSMLHDNYLKRLMRGDEDFAVNELGLLGTVISTLSNFFDEGNWTKPSTELVKGDRILLLKEAGRHLTALKGYAASPVGDCYNAALNVIDSTDESERFGILLGLCRYHRLRGELKRSGQIAAEIRQLARGKPEIAAGERAISSNYFYCGEFKKCEEHAKLGMTGKKRRHQAIHGAHLDLNEPSLSCQGYLALAKWFLGDMAGADSLATEAKEYCLDVLGEGHTAVILLLIRAMIFQFEGDSATLKVEADELAELATKKGFTIWRTAGEILKQWALSKSIDSEEIFENLRELVLDWKRAEARLFLPYWHALTAEVALGLAHLDQALAEISHGLEAASANGEHWWDAELFRLRALALAAKKEEPREVARWIRRAYQIAKAQEASSLQLRARDDGVRLLPARLFRSIQGIEPPLLQGNGNGVSASIANLADS